jgi:hypothetical protein
MPGPSLRSASGQSCWSGFRLDGGPSGRLQVKDTEHELACQLDLHYGETRPDGSRRVIIVSSWVIDSIWVISQRIPGLGRRIVMTCSSSLEPDT